MTEGHDPYNHNPYSVKLGANLSPMWQRFLNREWHQSWKDKVTPRGDIVAVRRPPRYVGRTAS